jgi:type IV pilus assembly protein PilP
VKTPRTKLLAATVALLGAPMLWPLACGGDAKPTPAKAAPSATPAASPGEKPAVAAASVAPSASGAALPPPVQYHEEDFAESEKSRDPFRSFFSVVQEAASRHVKQQRQVMMDRYAVDELKLIGIVTRADPPRAMLVDPTGRGWVVTKGMFIGRAESVHTGGPGGVEYELNWRIDRVRDGDIVLLREDPGHPDVPPASRVIALRPEKAENTGEIEVH